MSLVGKVSEALREENYDKVRYLLKLDDDLKISITNKTQKRYVNGLLWEFKAINVNCNDNFLISWFRIDVFDRIRKNLGPLIRIY